MLHPLFLLLLAVGVSWSGAATAQKASIDVELKNRKVAGERVFRVKQGDEVRVRWSADEEVDIHLHGYNIQKKIVPGQPTEWRFQARATGRFPITSHGYAKDKKKAKKSGHGHGAPHKESALIYIEVHPR